MDHFHKLQLGEQYAYGLSWPSFGPPLEYPSIWGREQIRNTFFCVSYEFMDDSLRIIIYYTEGGDKMRKNIFPHLRKTFAEKLWPTFFRKTKTFSAKLFPQNFFRKIFSAKFFPQFFFPQNFFSAKFFTQIFFPQNHKLDLVSAGEPSLKSNLSSGSITDQLKPIGVSKIKNSKILLYFVMNTLYSDFTNRNFNGNTIMESQAEPMFDPMLDRPHRLGQPTSMGSRPP